MGPRKDLALVAKYSNYQWPISTVVSTSQGMYNYMQCPCQQSHNNKAIDAETSQTQSNVLIGRPFDTVLAFVFWASTAPIVGDGTVAWIPF